MCILSDTYNAICRDKRIKQHIWDLLAIEKLKKKKNEINEHVWITLNGG